MAKTKTVIRAKTGMRGGKREGAGRPMGTGKYGEPTQAIRLPNNLVVMLKKFLQDYGKQSPLPLEIFKTQLSQMPMRRPLFDYKVAAGFPSPAADHIDTQLDLNEYVIKNPATTFYVRVEGESMLGAGIHPNDLLVVDLSAEAKSGSIIIALVDGEFTVKRLRILRNKKVQLVPENDNYPVIEIKEGMDFRIWGVVTNVIHSLMR